MRPWWLLGACSLAACGFSASRSADAGIDREDAAIADALGDSDIGPLVDGEVPAVLVCAGDYKVVCAFVTPQRLQVQAGTTTTINTDTSPSCKAPQTGSTIGDACVLAFQSFEINGTVRAVGNKPLVLFAPSGTITVAIGGLVDLGSGSPPAERGAGGRTTCVPAAAPTSGGGGPGGSYGGPGGNGGNGASGNGGIADVAVVFGDLVGGCNGAKGGDASAVSAGGLGGSGGGALLLIAPTLAVAGGIDATGGRGLGGKMRGGGGGGGSGGTVVLDGNLEITGRVWAQGGGGAEGGGPTQDGKEGGVTSFATVGFAALGGEGNSDGGPGGNGAVAAGGSSGGGSGSDGGGGGGGGTGILRTTDATPSAATGKVVPLLISI